jgi:hypothetical protein
MNMKHVETGHRRTLQISRIALAAGFFLLSAGGAHAAEMRNVHGCVVDETGAPVAHADVAFFWTANGPLDDPSGKPYDFDTVEGRRALSANLGKMFPLGDIERPTKTGPDGRFSMSIPGDRHHLVSDGALPQSRGPGDPAQGKGSGRCPDPSRSHGSCPRID